jgi:hypothetical protein
MKKNMYKQPQMQVTALMPTTIICGSITHGPDVPPGGATPEDGD